MMDRRVREEIDEDSLCVCVNSGVQRGVAIILQPASPTVRYSAGPTEKCLFSTFTFQVRTATKYKFAGIHKKDLKL